MIEVSNFRVQATKNIGFSKKYSGKSMSAQNLEILLRRSFWVKEEISAN